MSSGQSVKRTSCFTAATTVFHGCPLHLAARSSASDSGHRRLALCQKKALTHEEVRACRIPEMASAMTSTGYEATVLRARGKATQQTATTHGVGGQQVVFVCKCGEEHDVSSGKSRTTKAYQQNEPLSINPVNGPADCFRGIEVNASVCASRRQAADDAGSPQPRRAGSRHLQPLPRCCVGRSVRNCERENHEMLPACASRPAGLPRVALLVIA